MIAPLTSMERIFLLASPLSELESVHQVLHHGPYDVASLSSIGPMVDYWQEAPPDILILYDRLPPMDGVELCKLLRADCDYSTPFIIIASRSALDSSHRTLAWTSSADDLINLPANPSELLALIGNRLRKQRAQWDNKKNNAITHYSAYHSSEGNATMTIHGKAELFKELSEFLLRPRRTASPVPSLKSLNSLEGSRGVIPLSGSSNSLRLNPAALIQPSTLAAGSEFRHPQQGAEARPERPNGSTNTAWPTPSSSSSSSNHVSSSIRRTERSSPAPKAPLDLDLDAPFLVSATGQQKQSPDLDQPLAPVQVLLADSDPMSMSLLSYALEEIGWIVTKVTDGEAAEKLIQSHLFDLVVLDYALPFRNGLEIIDTILSTKAGRETSTRYVIVSEQGQDENVMKAFYMGADDFIQKPFNPDVVVSRLKRLI